MLETLEPNNFVLQMQMKICNKQPHFNIHLQTWLSGMHGETDFLYFYAFMQWYDQCSNHLIYLEDDWNLANE